MRDMIERSLRPVFAPEDGGAGGAGGAATGGSSGAVPPGGAPPGAGAGSGSPKPPTSPAPPGAFADQLPANLRTDAVFAGIKSLDELAGAYHTASKLLGNRDPKSLFALPGAEDKEGWNALYQKLGRPEAADKYQRPDVKLPDGMTLNDQLISTFQAQAHNAGLTDRQFQALMGWYVNQNISERQARDQAAAQYKSQVEADLTKEWGTANKQNLELAQRALAEYGGKELSAFLDQSGLGNNPALIKAFARLGKELAEDGKLQGRTNGQGLIASPNEAKQQIAALQRDKSFMADWTNKNAPGHKDAIAKLEGLFQIAYPEQSKN